MAMDRLKVFVYRTLYDFDWIAIAIAIGTGREATATLNPIASSIQIYSRSLPNGPGARDRLRHFIHPSRGSR